MKMNDSFDNSSIIRIGQISDPHIGDLPAPISGKEVSEHFLQALSAVKKANCDLLVISGDIAQVNGEEKSYLFFNEAMNKYKGRWCAISGNHDRNEVFSRLVKLDPPMDGDEYFYKISIKNRAIFFLDSSKNEVSDRQLSWLKEEASRTKDEILLFMHHPPCLCHHRFMDAHYAIKKMGEVQKALREIKNLRSIFVGHYHSNLQIQWEWKNIYVTPSTQMQLDATVEEFKVESTRPAWRLIKWGKDFLETSVQMI